MILVGFDIFLSGNIGYSRLVLFISCPTPRFHHFSKKLQFLLMKIVIRTVDCTMIWAQRMLIVTGLITIFRPLRQTELRNLYKIFVVSRMRVPVPTQAFM